MKILCHFRIWKLEDGTKSNKGWEYRRRNQTDLPFCIIHLWDSGEVIGALSLNTQGDLKECAYLLVLLGCLTNSSLSHQTFTCLK